MGAEAQELLASGFVFKRTDRLSILGPVSKLGRLRVIRGCSVAGGGAACLARPFCPLGSARCILTSVFHTARNEAGSQPEGTWFGVQTGGGPRRALRKRIGSPGTRTHGCHGPPRAAPRGVAGVAAVSRLRPEVAERKEARSTPSVLAGGPLDD